MKTEKQELRDMVAELMDALSLWLDSNAIERLPGRLTS